MKVFKSNELQISSCAGRKQEDLILSIVKPLSPTTLSVFKFRKNLAFIRNLQPKSQKNLSLRLQSARHAGFNQSG